MIFSMSMIYFYFLICVINAKELLQPKETEHQLKTATCLENQYEQKGQCKNCSDSIDNCSQCKYVWFFVSCSSCETGYILNNDKCDKCSMYIDGCYNCTDKTHCYSCLDGYIYQDNSCKSCSNFIDNCFKCSDTSKCEICIEGYRLTNDNKCVKCSNGCARCNDDETCVTCSDGYYLNGTVCKKCIEGCSVCSNEISCEQCDEYHYKENNVCKNCSNVLSNCLTCNDESTCESCIDGYYYYERRGSKSCKQCDSSCKTCSGRYENNCLSCNKGSYLSSNSYCTSCSELINCTDCITADICKECSPGSYLNENKKCSSCISNCLECKDGSTCQKCNDGYYLDNNNHCKPCFDNCEQCSSNEICEKCFDGYLLSGDKKQCNNCDENCLTCETTTDHCSSCNASFYLKDNKCLNCNKSIDFCEECSDDQTCTKCDKYHSLNNTNKCIDCSTILENCLTCSAGRCTSCVDGYFYYYSYYNNRCNQCHTTCKTCSGGGEDSCTSCNKDRYLSSNKCLLCSESISNCEECENSNKCTKCKERYYVTNQNKCSQCIEGCINCIDGSSCQKCDNGYFLNENNKCVKCSSSITNCDECSDKDTCTKCSKGFSIDTNNKCITCSETLPNCLTCESKDICSSCEEGYFVASGYCLPCSDNCLQCNSPSYCSKCNESTILKTSNDGKGYCEECQDGFYYSQNKCNSCNIQNCKTCTKSGNTLTCITCKDGYYYSQNKCNSCNIQNCKTCQRKGSTFTCTTCQDGYSVNNNGKCQSNTNNNNCEIGYYFDTSSNSCKKCLDNCAVCSDSSTCSECFAPYIKTESNTCQLCKQQQYWENGKCQTNMRGCIQQISKLQCIQCENEYYLIDGICFKHQKECTNSSEVHCQICEDNIAVQGDCSNKESNCYYNRQSSVNTKSDYCFVCSDNYILQNDDNKCKENVINSQTTATAYHFNQIYQCKSEYYLTTEMKCEKCSTNQEHKQFSNCFYYNNTLNALTCSGNTYLNNETLTCETDNKSNKYKDSFCIECKEDHNEIRDGICQECKDAKCSFCEGGKCHKCDKGYVLQNSNSCKENTTFECNLFVDHHCVECKEGFELNQYIARDKETQKENNEYIYCVEIKTKNCLQTTYHEETSECIYCKHDYLLMNNECVENTQIKNEKLGKESLKTSNEICLENSHVGCLRCNEGWFINGTDCEKCSNNCQTCSNKSTCLTCPIGYYLEKNKTCSHLGKLNDTCKEFMPDFSGCAICQDGYYHEEKLCEQCPNGCKLCFSEKVCLQCSPLYFMIEGEEPICKPFDELDHCLNDSKTQTGCYKCENGYYTEKKRCKKCPKECITCDSSDSCFSCAKDHILVERKCLHYSQIKHCEGEENNRCKSCSSGYELTKDGLSCVEKENYGLLVGLPVSLVSLFFIILIIIFIVMIIFYQRKKEKKKMEGINMFKLKNSEIEFEDLNEICCISTKTINFNEDCDAIPVDKPTSKVFYIGNKSNCPIKVQMSVMDENDRYEIYFQPQLMMLKKGMVCEFTITIHPFCSFALDEEIKLVSLKMDDGKEFTETLKFMVTTKVSTHLDYREIVEEKKIGEGSFGVVFIGTFRGNKVAIKRLKQLDDEKSKDEFEKEVNMLDKFRNEYIIHFYGAVFIPNKICMVTEFAEYGSIQDMINKYDQVDFISNKMKLKIMKDSAKGIQYLHSNGILHRDIKPDNFLVVSLDENTPINAKLTDFGSSRNINQMMTNMTFTKGIGSPTYMAPEVLKKQHYKMPADIFAFGITIYEMFGWCSAYPKKSFKFPWKIAEFVVKGERPEKPYSMPFDVFVIIEKCWCDNPSERLKIDEVINELENF